MSSSSTPSRALLLGATTGIGFALARQLAARGIAITVTGRSSKSAADAVARLRAEFPTAQIDGSAVDLREHAAARRTLSEGAAIDHLGLCGSSDVAWGPFASLQIDAVTRALHMKLTGFLNAVQAVLPRLASHGSITFVGGAAGRTAMPGTVGLAAVNGGLEAVTRTLARELAPRRVNLVSPGLTDTEAYAGMPVDAKANLFAGTAARLPVGRAGQPDEIADAIAFVVTNGFVTGSVVDVDGGSRVV